MVQGRVSYDAQRGCARITDYSIRKDYPPKTDTLTQRDISPHSQESRPKSQDMTEKKKMEAEKVESTQISWDEACASKGTGKYLTLESGVRKTIVAKNPRFEEVEVTFQNKTSKKIQLTLDVVEEDNEEVAKTWNTVSKRLKDGLRPLFENVDAEKEVRFTVKKIGKDTDTNYDVEKL